MTDEPVFIELNEHFDKERLATVVLVQAMLAAWLAFILAKAGEMADDICVRLIHRVQVLMSESIPPVNLLCTWHRDQADKDSLRTVSSVASYYPTYRHRHADRVFTNGECWLMSSNAFR
jgi:hypothetical protein